MEKILEIHIEEKFPELGDKEKKEIMSKLDEYDDVKLERILNSENGIAVEEWRAPSADRVREVIENLLGEDHCDLVVEVEEIDI